MRSTPSSNSRRSPSIISPAVSRRRGEPGRWRAPPAARAASRPVSQRTASRKALVERVNHRSRDSSLHRTSDHHGLAAHLVRLASHEDGVTRPCADRHRRRLQPGERHPPAHELGARARRTSTSRGCRPTSPGDWEDRLAAYDGVWIAPASPYRSMDGAAGGGVATRASAESRWSAPEAASSTRSSSSRATSSGTETPTTLKRAPTRRDWSITALACSLVGQDAAGGAGPRTRAARLYARDRATEPYYCNYGVNPDYRLQFEACGLRVSGVGAEGEIRIVELPEHPFFVATLFLPQARSTPRAPPAARRLRGRGRRLSRSPRPPLARQTLTRGLASYRQRLP